MRAVVCTTLGAPDKLAVEERPGLVPGPGQVIVAAQACGVNFVDVLMIQGRYQIRPEPPFVPGGEVAGRVKAVGEGVEEVAVGDAVIAMSGLNGFAEEVAARAGDVLPLPAGMEPTIGASFVQSYATALFALTRRSEVREGETMLVLGAAGGTGLAAIDVGKALGARVIAAASSDEKLALCREHGADLVLRYDRDGPGDLKERAKELSGGGVDLVYDPIGGAYAEQALRALAPRGRYLVIGFASGEIPRVPFNLILLKSCQVVGVDWGGSTRRDPVANRALLAELGELFASGRIHPAPPQIYPLERAGEALADLMARRLAGKAVLVP